MEITFATDCLHPGGQGTDGTGGATLAYELKVHVEAGIPVWEVLRMVTSGNAALMDLTDTGRIVPGKEADIVFLKASPVADIANVKQVAFTVSNGALYEREQLLDIPRAIAREATARMQAGGEQSPTPPLPPANARRIRASPAFLEKRG